ncbi:GNAT family N-acetyltransferase (plasmid) [Amycolatopsis sp. FU40]|uniref:GNAT family N-acetyltransferase n=1 Tax=Amycolatopsis sp. FU40 TaxID=2914159 RepID=UPI001F45D062|nr:GNAT family N-acetyltransferase [Amycolatopsis sp. FU40]UKD50717.1 GNAT family N-acetyltransferase [Amycolatopsis sp. FU40]
MSDSFAAAWATWDTARGEGQCPVRPGRVTGDERPARCLAGHDLALAGCSLGYNHTYRTSTVSCRVCQDLRHPRATWALIDPAAESQVMAGADVDGLALVVTPPPRPGVAGTIELRTSAESRGRVELLLCGPCRRAVAVALDVRPEHRRTGVGTVLVEAARARGAGCRWTTVPRGADAVARAFWCRAPLLGPDRPQPCSHMLTAGWSHPDMAEAGWVL